MTDRNVLHHYLEAVSQPQTERLHKIHYNSHGLRGNFIVAGALLVIFAYNCIVSNDPVIHW